MASKLIVIFFGRTTQSAARLHPDYGPAGTSLPELGPEHRIVVVFGAHLLVGKRDLWKFVLDYYLRTLKTTGLEARAERIHVCLNSDTQEELRLGKDFVLSYLPNAVVTAAIGNEYEYRGKYFI